MSEQKKKPTFVELALDLLDKDKIDIFLDFIRFLKENQLTLKKQSTYIQVVSYKKEHICSLCLFSNEKYKPDGNWGISPINIFFNEYDLYVTNEKLKKLIICSLNFNLCKGCNGSQNPYCNGGSEHLGKTKLTIFGKIFNNVCNGVPLKIISPDKEELELVKELVLISKKIIADKLAEGE